VQLQDDVLAGVSVAALVVPQGMSYARLAGLPSVYGLYGAFVPVLCYAALGSSRQLVRAHARCLSPFGGVVLFPCCLDPLSTLCSGTVPALLPGGTPTEMQMFLVGPIATLQ
jgi:hypothetical protein